MKKSPKQDARVRQPVSFVVLVGVMIFAFGMVGGTLLTAHFRASQPVFASGLDLEAARKAIIAAYLVPNTQCKQDTTTPAERTATFYKYLRVNRYADRAVIRGCYDSDSMLAKVKDGSWQKTTVNISLDLRANPEWQKACKIEDITVADSVVRPENRSIDSFNLEACDYLAAHGAVMPFPHR